MISLQQCGKFFGCSVCRFKASPVLNLEAEPEAQIKSKVPFGSLKFRL